MKTITILIFSWLTACGCLSTQKELNAEKIIYQEPVPDEIIVRYLKEMNLSNIKESSYDFELRVWNNFVHDSFPTSLERYYLKNGNLKGELYLFKTNKNKIISDTNQIEKEGIVFQRIALQDLPIRFSDTLMNKFDFSKMQSFNPKLLNSFVMNGYTTASPNLVLFEQALSNKYSQVFIYKPVHFENINPGIDFLNELCRFTEDSLLLSDKNITAEITTFFKSAGE